MGRISPAKLIILAGCFFCTAMLAHFELSEDSQPSGKKSQTLRQSLSDIPGWKLVAFHPLDKEIVDALKLDDYINADYVKGSSKISLYVGYYLTGRKLGAAHHPLVCFPGQGWLVTDRLRQKLRLTKSLNAVICYSSMIIRRGDEQELVIYWFQSNDRTSPGTFLQKVFAFLNRFYRDSGENAFVRITVSLDGSSIQDAGETVDNFIQAFYPVFLKYINS